MHKLHGGRNNVFSLSPLSIHKNRCSLIYLFFIFLDHILFLLNFFSFFSLFLSFNFLPTIKNRANHAFSIANATDLKTFSRFFFLNYGKHGFLRDWAYDGNDILSVFSSKQMHAIRFFLSRV